MTSKWRKRSVPSQSLLNEWLRLGWDWNKRSVFREQNHLHFLFMPFWLNSYNFQMYPLSVHTAAGFSRERESNYTWLRAVLVQGLMDPKHRDGRGKLWVRNLLGRKTAGQQNTQISQLFWELCQQFSPNPLGVPMHTVCVFIGSWRHCVQFGFHLTKISPQIAKDILDSELLSAAWEVQVACHQNPHT